MHLGAGFATIGNQPGIAWVNVTGGAYNGKRQERTSPVSWDDLLLAISPQRGFDNADLRRVIDAITTAQQEGHITDEDAEELLKVLLAAVVSGRVNAMVGDFFTPDARGHLGARFGKRVFPSHSRRFSLI